MTFTVRHDKLFSSAGLLHHQFKSHRRICAAMDGPYQSPAFFPELLPSSTSRCMPKGAVGLSANQRKILLCVLSTGLSRMDPQLKCRLLLLSLSLELNPSFTECIRSMSSLTTRWFPDQVQPFYKKKRKKTVVIEEFVYLFHWEVKCSFPTVLICGKMIFFRMSFFLKIFVLPYWKMLLSYIPFYLLYVHYLLCLIWCDLKFCNNF